MAGIKSLRKAAKAVQAKGRNGDTILAHITPQEAAMLKRMGGAGTRNPYTGMREFYDGSSSSGDSSAGPSSSGETPGDGPSGGGVGGGGVFDSVIAARGEAANALTAEQKKAQEAAKAAEKAATQARIAQSYSNPMAHIAGQGTGYQGNLDTYRPNYYSYGPAQAMQFGANYQAPTPQGGMENALNRMASNYSAAPLSQQDQGQWMQQLRSGMNPAVAQRSMLAAPAGFNEIGYLTANPDVLSAVRQGKMPSGYQHFQQYGQQEGRLNPAGFDEASYLSANPDVAGAINAGTFKSGAQHYQNFGRQEGRGVQGWDESGYLAANPDVAAAVKDGRFHGGYQHYQQFGQGEGRLNPYGFNAQSYLANNPDVAAAVTSGQFKNAFDHYQQFGHNEDRTMKKGGLASLPGSKAYQKRFPR